VPGDHCVQVREMILAYSQAIAELKGAIIDENSAIQVRSVFLLALF
jgi:hypothetical protein